MGDPVSKQMDSTVWELGKVKGPGQASGACGPGTQLQRPPRARPYLHGVLRVGGSVYTPLAHGVGAHPDVLLDLIAVGEVDVVPVQLLEREEGASELSAGTERGHRVGGPDCAPPTWRPEGAGPSHRSRGACSRGSRSKSRPPSPLEL